ncbi:substrate-binding domain-containing protein [Okeania sp. SIO2B3]|uniref:substrate-binding domain-containing protein n=1 Tax=Okeania sp. SIO2B3 TaxID=2607784 RepID=UPI0025D13D3E|nr:substrate-binding domain-containing protein [Okeania sp. SIO2B3]
MTLGEDSTMTITNQKSIKNNRILSGILTCIAVALAYAPIPGLNQKIIVVSGTEFAEPLQQIETQFEQKYPHINLELKFQGSQDIINNYIDQKNDFNPTVLIPTNAALLDELNQRWQSQNNTQAFYQQPTAIAKTFLVGIAWPERGKILFPNGKFSWQQLEKAMAAGSWQKIGGQQQWGSFDFVTTDPTRSNSGQITMNLWAKSKGNNNLNTPAVESLFSTVKRSVYLPPRSTDILLQEFIARGPNDADVATVYESIALYRWQQSGAAQNKPYQVYYLNPTVETVATAAVVRRDVNGATANAAGKFIDFLTQPEQQKVFVQYGFRPTHGNIDLLSVANSPWNQNIPGAQVNPQISTLPAPQPSVLGEIQKLWQRVQ